MSNKHEHATGGRLCKMALKALVFSFIFGLGVIVGELRFTAQADHQVDDSHQQVAYVYDTEQKVEDFYKTFETQFSEENGLPLESPEVKEYVATAREQFGRPLVAAGPFAIFAKDDGRKFSVHEIQSVKQEKGLLFPLIELETGEQSKRLHLHSSQEKGYQLPRFHAKFDYSEDGTYEKSNICLHEEFGKLVRFYYDTQGAGAFDRMVILENGTLTYYRLNGLSWEKSDREKPEQNE